MPFKDPERRREYIREYQREWMRRRREEWFEGRSCVECGSTERLEADHIDPTQKVSHRIWSWAKERRDAELAKCQVLCQPCHLKKTLEQRGGTDHGRGQMYNAYKCRCDRCRAWKRERMKQYRINRSNRINGEHR